MRKWQEESTSHHATAIGDSPSELEPVRSQVMIVTIDGPAGSGKSTAARKLAARLQIAYLDTGAMYRAIAHVALQRGVNFDNEDTLVELAQSVGLDMDCGPAETRVRVNGQDVSEAIRTMAVSRVTPHVARCQAIRALLVARQREIGKSLGSFVSEGRDQGSVVFPDADVRFVLEASLERRAERRVQEMRANGQNVNLAEVIDNLRARDEVDAVQWEVLTAPGQATLVDTSDMTIAQMVDRLAKQVLAVKPGSKDSSPAG